MCLFVQDASVWKEAFEKAKKIVGSECEIYAGKSKATDKHSESDSDSSSDVSYSESTDNEEQTKKGAEDECLKVQNNEVGKSDDTAKQTKTEESMDKVSHELEQLQVKELGGKK